MKSTLVKVAVVLAIFLFLFSQIDIGSMVRRFGELRLETVLVCLILSLSQIAMLAYRWVLVSRIQSLPLPMSEAMRCMLASQFFSQGLPASVGGDLLRVWWLTRLDVAIGHAGQNVLLDRMAGLFALLLLNVMALGLLGWVLGQSQHVPAIGGVLVVGLAAIVLPGSRFGRRIVCVLAQRGRHRLPAGLRRRLPVSWVLRLLKVLGTLLFSGPGLITLFWGVLIHLVTVLITFVVIRDAGISVSPLAAMAVVPAVLIVSYLPFSFGGWGVREGGMAFALVLLGGTATDGVFIGLALGAFGLGAALAGALVWLVSPMPISISGQRKA